MKYTVTIEAHYPAIIPTFTKVSDDEVTIGASPMTPSPSEKIFFAVLSVMESLDGCSVDMKQELDDDDRKRIADRPSLFGN